MYPEDDYAPNPLVEQLTSYPQYNTVPTTPPPRSDSRFGFVNAIRQVEDYLQTLPPDQAEQIRAGLRDSRGRIDVNRALLWYKNAAAADPTMAPLTNNRFTGGTPPTAPAAPAPHAPIYNQYYNNTAPTSGGAQPPNYGSGAFTFNTPLFSGTPSNASSSAVPGAQPVPGVNQPATNQPVDYQAQAEEKKRKQEWRAGLPSNKPPVA